MQLRWALVLAYLAVQRSKGVTLPAPAGAYPVGRLITTWTDKSRQENLGGTPGGHRTLSVWIWYPAEHNGSTLPYMPSDWARAREADRGIGSLLFQAIGSVHGHATDARPTVDGGPFPVLIFEPGLGPSGALAIVSYPTDEETEANLDRLTEEDRTRFQARKEWLARWEKESLKSAAELPELSGKTLTLIWDLHDHGDERCTVIRHGTVIVWREPAGWGGYERFMEVLAILKARYGERLVDVVPSPASELYFFGDRLQAVEDVADARRRLRGTPG